MLNRLGSDHHPIIITANTSDHPVPERVPKWNFFDLQKAYDTTWQHGIQQDLHDMGLRGNLPIFIGNFLTDRTFQVHLGTILSDGFHQEGVLPQGAILSNTLFNVKINNIVKQVDHGVECSFYVDNFVIMYKSPTTDAILRKLQHTINRLEKWTLENGFPISKNKTVAMHFCPDKKMYGSCFEIGKRPYPVCKRSYISWFNLGYKTHLWTSYQISQSTVSKIPEYSESPLSYRMGCRSNYIIEIISLPC